jgi:hypothetical protein
VSRKEYVESNQMVVDRKRYAELQSMEFRHLGYLRAAEYMGLMQQRHAKLYRNPENREKLYHLGALDMIKTMAEVQLRMVQQTLDAHPGHDTTPGPFRKGQLCLTNQHDRYCLVVAREEE